MNIGTYFYWICAYEWNCGVTGQAEIFMEWFGMLVRVKEGKPSDFKKLISTYCKKRYWGYSVCKIWLRGDFLILLKYVKGNFKEERNTINLYKVQDERKWD